MSKRIDLKNQRFGRLFVKEIYTKQTNNGEIGWICICDCGKEKIVKTRNLRRGKTNSCGCLKSELCKQRSGSKHSSWLGGIVNKGSQAWATSVLNNLKYVAKQKEHASPTKETTYKEVQELWNKANGICKICTKYLGENLSLDHCHITGKLRGFICSDCNLALGGFKDSKERLQNAINYLEENKEIKIENLIKNN